MRFDKIVRGFAALAATAMVTGCNVTTHMGDFEGEPLSQLDTSGETPTSVHLSGPDTVVVTQGPEFAITLDGDEAMQDFMLFRIEDGALKVGRNKGESNGPVIVRVTMPALQALAIGGAGVIEADRTTGNVDIAIGGSGSVRVAEVDAQRLDLAIGGSGNVELSGKAEVLDLAIGGSGSAKMRGLKVDRADISIGGSGKAAFSSDGKVEASIAGSGDVTVYGDATCEVSSFGSGKLRCERGETAAAEGPAE